MADSENPLGVPVRDDCHYCAFRGQVGRGVAGGAHYKEKHFPFTLPPFSLIAGHFGPSPTDFIEVKVIGTFVLFM